MRKYVVLAVLAAVAYMSCASPSPPAQAPAKAHVATPAPADSEGLHLSVPPREWPIAELDGATIRFPPGWGVHYDSKIDGWICTGSKGHRCYFKTMVTEFAPEDVAEYLALEKSTLKVMRTELDGDQIVAWAAFDEDGDPWAHMMRWHGKSTYHLAYLVVRGKPVPDDFFAIMMTLGFDSSVTPKAGKPDTYL